jgi:competence protein ComEA
MADHPPASATPHPHAPVCARRTQLAVVVLASAVLLLVGFRWADARTGTRPSERTRGAAAKIDLNKAGRAELLQLPGLGPTRTDKILAYRQAHGNFQRIEDLHAVGGIGPVTLERLKPLLSIEATSIEESSDEPLRLSRKPVVAEAPRKSGKKPTPESVVDVNRASATDLRNLPGIGPTLAQRIIEAREKKPFEKIEDLRRVSGIGPKRLEQLRPFVTVAD